MWRSGLTFWWRITRIFDDPSLIVPNVIQSFCRWYNLHPDDLSIFSPCVEHTWQGVRFSNSSFTWRSIFESICNLTQTQEIEGYVDSVGGKQSGWKSSNKQHCLGINSQRWLSTGRRPSMSAKLNPTSHQMMLRVRISVACVPNALSTAPPTQIYNKKALRKF